MDDPAPLPPEPETTPGRRAFNPLTRLQKRIYGALTALGILVIGLTVHLSDSNLPGFVIGGMAGAGGSLLAMGAMMLFHRPGR